VLGKERLHADSYPDNRSARRDPSGATLGDRPDGAATRPALMTDRAMVAAPLSGRAAGAPLWTYAAVYGALWGALEITLGSLLHAARLPLIGLVMAWGQAAYLVALHRLQRRPGLAVTTALVAAAVKGLSPTGAVLAPMIAIAAQGALVELCLRLPGDRLSALVAGALAPLWAVVQMVLTHLLLFGLPAVELYGRVIATLARATGLAPHNAWAAVALPVGIIAAVGALGALWGRRVGDAAARLLTSAQEAR
jgi:hypothetical protein